MEALTLRVDNPYADGKLIQLPNNDIILNREKITYKPTVYDKRHTVIQGDNLTALAYQYYRNVTEYPSRYWWIIADANNILNPLDISDLIGYEIIIPDFNEATL